MRSSASQANGSVPALYAVLGVTPDISATDLARHYKRLSLQYHPDRLAHQTSSGPLAREAQKNLLDKFQAITAAYEILSDPKRRTAYDTQHAVNFRSRVNSLRDAILQHNEDLGKDEGSTCVTASKRPRDEPNGSVVPDPAVTGQNAETSANIRHGKDDDDDDDDDEYSPEDSPVSTAAPFRPAARPAEFSAFPASVQDFDATLSHESFGPSSSMNYLALSSSSSSVSQKWRGITLYAPAGAPRPISWGLNTVSSASGRAIILRRCEGLSTGKIPTPSVLVQMNDRNVRSHQDVARSLRSDAMSSNPTTLHGVSDEAAGGGSSLCIFMGDEDDDKVGEGGDESTTVLPFNGGELLPHTGLNDTSEDTSVSEKEQQTCATTTAEKRGLSELERKEADERVKEGEEALPLRVVVTYCSCFYHFVGDLNSIAGNRMKQQKNGGEETRTAFSAAQSPSGALEDDSLSTVVLESLVPDPQRPEMPTVLEADTTVLSVNGVAVETGKDLRLALRRAAQDVLSEDLGDQKRLHAGSMLGKDRLGCRSIVLECCTLQGLPFSLIH